VRTLDKDMAEFAISHRHSQAFVWAPKQMGVIATIENAKAVSAMASTRAIMVGALGATWPRRASSDVRVYPLPTAYIAATDSPPILRERFNALANEWEADTAFTSDLNEMAVHQNYQDIIWMGLPVLPFIFERLEDSPARWFWALRSIVGHDVAAGSTTSAEAVERWLEWGHANGYVNVT
jgi:hypothetical protein